MRCIDPIPIFQENTLIIIMFLVNGMTNYKLYILFSMLDFLSWYFLIKNLFPFEISYVNVVISFYYDVVLGFYVKLSHVQIWKLRSTKLISLGRYIFLPLCVR